MKITLKALASFLAVVALLTYSGCGGDPAPAKSIEEQQLEKLVATWNVSSVTYQSTTSKTAEYPGFKLTISGTAGSDTFQYTTAGRPATSPWPRDGNFEFGTKPESDITRIDSQTEKILVNYAISADGNQLKLIFDFTGAGYSGARTSNVKGQWEFNFTK